MIVSRVGACKLLHCVELIFLKRNYQLAGCHNKAANQTFVFVYLLGIVCDTENDSLEESPENEIHCRVARRVFVTLLSESHS